MIERQRLLLMGVSSAVLGAALGSMGAKMTDDRQTCATMTSGGKSYSLMRTDGLPILVSDLPRRGRFHVYLDGNVLRIAR